MIIIPYTLAFCAVVYHTVAMLAPKLYRNGVSAALQGGAAVFLLAALIERSLTIGFVALTSTFESLLFYGLIVLSINIAYVLQHRYAQSSGIRFWMSLAALGFLLIGTSPLIGKEALPPVPALRSAWLILHVAFSFIGEGFFVFAFILSVRLLIKRKSSDTETGKTLDEQSYAATVAGYGFFTLGALVFGAVWAETAWGSFWSWDPKETWALITWLVYSLYLHLRIYRKADVRVCAWINALGFAATVFTFFGVNYLLPGLHSYG